MFMSVAAAKPAPFVHDPFPGIYPGGERPKHLATAAVYTGNPAKVRNAYSSSPEGPGETGSGRYELLFLKPCRPASMANIYGN